MKKLLIFVFLLLATPAFAQESNIQIQKSTSTINSSANGGSTDVTVDDNGNVTHYTSDEGGSVSVKSVNGNTNITANGKEVSPTVSKITPSIAPTQTIKTALEKKKSETKSQSKNIIEILKEKIFSIFKQIKFF